MDREVASAFRLAAGLMILAAFLGIVTYTVYFGNQIKNMALNEGIDMANDSKYGILSELRYNDETMPAASAYAIIEQNYNSIDTVECRVNQEGIDLGAVSINEFSCLKNHLTGKISMEVVQSKISGLFTIVIHKEICNWMYDGTCICGE